MTLSFNIKSKLDFKCLFVVGYRCPTTQPFQAIFHVKFEKACKKLY